jgi:hypothetical protein
MVKKEDAVSGEVGMARVKISYKVLAEMMRLLKN